ncbi:MAG TPA: DJ-1/PfpI family protein [Iamia sp.]
MRISVLLFDRFTALDVVGGYEVLARLPDVEVEFVSTDPGLVATDTRRLGMVSYRRLDALSACDVLYVPGGPGVDAVIDDTELVAKVRQLSETASWTVAICNGVAILGAAGLITGRRVTTNWGWRDRVSAYGATVVPERYVQDDTIVTGAGVSASIDAALYLTTLVFGDEIAELVQLGIEYFPRSPVGPSSVEEVSDEAKASLRAWMEHSEPSQLELTPPWPTVVAGR